jgi:hypothetical protein
MAMELRFVVRKVPVDAFYGQGAYQEVRVLQFRTEEGPEGEGWWSEWQDVPLVREQEG